MSKENENGNLAKPMLAAVAVSQTKYEPCIIQSAFLLSNGNRIVIYTGALGIKSFECDENYKPFPKPFAECPKEMMSENPTDYHRSIRKMHGEEKLVKEHSTEIDW